jgi:23S rRNA (guanosine2251-2'-O)-methyltransferase
MTDRRPGAEPPEEGGVGRGRRVEPAASVVYGAHPVAELVRHRAKAVLAIWVAQSADAARPGILAIERAAHAAGVPVERRGRPELDALVSSVLPDGAAANHQGVVALLSSVGRTRSLDELLDELLDASTADALPAAPALVVLDSIQDPQNFGAIARSAHVLGAAAMVIPKDRAVGVTSAGMKASAGALAHLEVCEVTNLVRALESLKQRGLWVVGAALDEEAVAPWQVDFTLPTALVIGSEGRGIRPLVRRHCDVLVEIPSRGALSALNASAAASVLLYELDRQRRIGLAPRNGLGPRVGKRQT